MAILREFFQHVYHKIKTFSIDVIRILLRGASSTSHAVSDFEVVIFFETVSCFASDGLKVLKCWRFGHARRLGHSTHEFTLNDQCPSQFLQGRKFLWITLEQLFEIFIKLPIFDLSRAICVLLRGQTNFGPISVRKGPKNLKTFGNPSHGRIESIKSAGKRSQIVTLRHFLGTLIPCRIYFPKNAIEQENPLETSHDLVLVLVCYAATQLATPLHQRRIQVVRSNKVAQKRLIESNGIPAMDPGYLNTDLTCTFTYCCEEVIHIRRHTNKRGIERSFAKFANFVLYWQWILINMNVDLKS